MGVVIPLPLRDSVWILTADPPAVARWVRAQRPAPRLWSDAGELMEAWAGAVLRPSRLIVDLDTPHGLSPTHWTEPLRAVAWPAGAVSCVAAEPSTPARLAARLLDVPLLSWSEILVPAH
jgi:hypothetical protein